MIDKKRLRKHLFVDPHVQGALVWRVIMYWFLCLGTAIVMLLCWRMLTGPARMFYTHFDDMWFHYGPALIASLLLLPLVVADIIRLSNRFTGPMVRLRREMRALARGEQVEPLRFRDDDFWHEFAEEFNAVVARVQGDRPNPSSRTFPDAQDEPEPVGAGIE
ncbi:MAG: hypothetical protein JW809_04440 [Pirellulales bacterium]|nr:hypothetical protein [Pirellulales bacterium]